MGRASQGTRSWVVNAAVVWAAAAVLSACGAGSSAALSPNVPSASVPDAPSVAATSAVAGTSGTSPTQDAATANLSGPGLLSASCAAGGAMELKLVDVATGSTLAGPVTVPAPLSVGTLGTVGVPSCPSLGGLEASSRLQLRQQFSPSFNSFTWASAPQSDGSQHIGYADMQGTSPVDVTALTTGTGFGSGTSIDMAPVFGTDSDLYFLRSHDPNPSSSHEYEVHHFNLDSKSDTIVGKVDTQDYLASPGPSTITVQHGVVVLGDWSFNPSGTLAAEGASGVVLVEKVTGGGVFNPQSDNNQTAPGSYIDGNNGISLYGWLKDDAVAVGINMYGSNSDIYRVAVRPSGVNNVKPVDLLPTNSDTNDEAVPASDGTSLVFTSTKGQVPTLYSVKATGGAQPVAVPAAMDSGTFILSYTS